MKRVIKPRPEIVSIDVYDSPMPEADIILNSNESPYNIPESLVAKIETMVESFDFNRYPDPGQFKLKEKIAEANYLQENMVALGNGGDELLLHTMLAYGGPGRIILDFPPTFSVYKFGASVTGTGYRVLPRDKNFTIDIDDTLKFINEEGVELVFLCNPNNPTGTLISEQEIARLLEGTDALVLVDEAYYQYSRLSCQDLLNDNINLVILRTFSKAFSFAGMRVGYILASPEIITNLEKVRLPYNVNAFSQALASLVIDNSSLFEEMVENTITDRDNLIREMDKIKGVQPFPSKANYVLFRVGDAEKVWQYLLDKGILIRIFRGDKFLDSCLRVTVGTPEENKLFLRELREALT